MHNFCMIFGCAMIVFFAVIAVVSILMFIVSEINGTQILLLIPCCAAGAGFAAELLDYGFHVK